MNIKHNRSSHFMKKIRSRHTSENLHHIRSGYHQDRELGKNHHYPSSGAYTDQSRWAMASSVNCCE